MFLQNIIGKTILIGKQKLLQIGKNAIIGIQNYLKTYLFLKMI
jgi:hypothetical protein